jgi:peptide/nickel transport system substrate-binding protein
VPWPIGAIDPHRLDDGFAAIFGDALFDTLYTYANASTIVPSLAEADPEPEGTRLRVRLRSDLRTAMGRSFEARDAAAAIARARSFGARAWLADIPDPKVDGTSLVFKVRSAARLAEALASPLVAMLPAHYSAESPDGTGPFRLMAREGGVVLVRNALAARGPAFLDEVMVRSAPDLASSLRAFERGTDDVGWLGSGLHEPRAGSRPFDFGAAGWAVLYTGRDALWWDAPGVAQRLCDGIDPLRLSHLALGPGWTPETQQGWGGAPTTLLVREDAPWLVELARGIAATISRPAHDVTAKLVPASELVHRRASRGYGLALDVVRPVAPGALGAMISLATSDDRERASDLALHPPKLGEVAARKTTRTLRCGVVGEIRVQGGRAQDLALVASPNASGFDLGASSRTSGGRG